MERIFSTLVKSIAVCLLTCIAVDVSAQLSGWAYVTPITLTETSGANLTDYQTLVTLDTQTPISAGKMNANGSDIRFASDLAGNNELYFWLGTGINTSATEIWVNIPNIPASGTVTIYVFYGKPSALSASNGDSTFLFFDDFTSGSISASKWAIATGTSSDVTTAVTEYVSIVDDGTAGLKTPQTLSSFTQPFILDLRFNYQFTGENTHYGFLLSDGFQSMGTYCGAVVGNHTGGGCPSDDVIEIIYGAVDDAPTVTTQYTSDDCLSPFAWHRFETKISSNMMGMKVDGMVYEAGQSTLTSGPFYLSLGGYWGQQPWELYGPSETWYDDIRVRKHSNSEPTSAVGAEMATTTITVAGGSICAGDSMLLTVVIDTNSSLIPPFSYAWSPSTGLTCDTCGGTYAGPSSTTTYTVMLTDSAGTQDSATATVSVSSSIPIADAGLDTIICEAASVQLVGSGGDTYLWIPSSGLSDSTIANPMASPTATVEYMLIAMNGCGSDTDSVVVTVNPIPVLLSNDTALCPGDTVQLMASGGTSYLWSPGTGLSSTSIANPIAAPTTTTAYSFTATSPLGCILNASITITVSIVPQIFAIIDKDTLCLGDSTQLNTIGATDCNDYDITTIAFNPPSSVGTNISLGDDQVSAGLPIGFTFNFYCVDYSTFYISSNGFITFNNDPASGCCSGQFLPDLSTPNNLVSFAWADLNPSSGGTITYATSGIAPNRILVMSFNSVPHFGGGGDVTSQVVLYEGTNAIEIHSTTMPAAGGLHTMGIENIDGTIAHVVPGRNSNSAWSAVNEGIRFTPLTLVDTTLNYSWTPATGLSNPNIYNPIASPDSTTTYIVTANAGSCFSSDTVTIYIDTNNYVDIAPISGMCSGDSVMLVVTGSPGQPATSTWSYSWSPVATLSDSTVASPYASPTVKTLYQVNVTNVCGSYSDTVSFDVLGAPTATAGPDASFCYGGSVQLSAGGGVSYLWAPSTFLSCTACDKTNANPLSDMTYFVTATDSAGCTDVDSVFVEVNGLPINASSDKSYACSASDTINLMADAISFCDDYSIQTITYAPIMGAGTAVVLGDDQVSIGLPIGFNFNFYCNDYTTFYISSNGFITFNNDPNSGLTGQLIPDISSPNNLIGFTWNDMNPSTGGTIDYYTAGAAPNRVLVMNYVDIFKFGGSIPDASLQVLLYENGNNIEIHTAYANSISGTMGLENFDGTLAHPVAGRNAATFSITNEGLRFSPLTAPPLDSNITYNWSMGAPVSDTGLANPYATPNIDAMYIVEVNDLGCIQTDTVLVFMDTTVISVFGDTTICLSDSTQLLVTGNTPLGFFSWTPAVGLNDPLIQNPIASPFSTTNYTVNVQSMTGCDFTSDPVTIAVETIPAGSFTSTSSDLIATFTNNSSPNAISYMWDFDDGFQASIMNPVHTYNANGTYNVCLTVTNICGSNTYCSSVSVTLGGCANTVAAFDTIVSNLTVVLEDMSTNVDSWMWDFGDGNTSTLQNPVHTYAADSTYNVCLTTTNSCSTDSICRMVSVSSGVIPCTPTVVGFTSNSVGLDAVFVSTSADATSWSWDFGDGNSSNAQNPVNSYSTDSTYNVCLVVSNACSSDSMCTNVTVSAASCPTTTAGFTTTAAGLTIGFTDTSTDPTAWNWDFGDGNFSTSQNPSYTYSAIGTYTVCLIVTNPCSADTSCTNITVTSCTAPTASFSNTENELTATFIDASTNSTSWAWDFGDGNASNLQNPSYTYSTSGTYQVCLTANSGCATDTYCDSVTVIACSTAIAAFVSTDSTLTVSFTNLSINADTWFWDFGDGFNSATQNATHIYAFAGTYNVCLAASNACTTDTSCSDITISLTGIGEVSSQGEMDVYPNPTDGVLNVSIPLSFNEAAKFTIFNILGEVVFQAPQSALNVTKASVGQTQYSLDLSYLADGTYMLQVQSGDKMFMEQVIFSR